MKIDCFDKVGLPHLAEKYKGSVTEGMSEAEQRDLGKQIASDYAKDLHDQLNALKSTIGKPETPFTPEDKSKEVDAIKEEYQQKIDEVNPPPPPPPTEEELAKAQDDEEWESIRKEKLKEIKGAKRIFEQRMPKAWNDTYESALSNLQKMYPKKSLYEAMKARVNDFVLRLNAKEIFNPTSEDIAVFNVLKAETNKRIRDVEGQDSEDSIVRMAANAELENYNQDLLNIAKVTNPEGEAGRAFNMHQSEIQFDGDNGLKIRRMELMKANGNEPLTPEDEAFVKEQWDKEKELLQREQEARTQQMKDDFDAKIKDLEAKLKIAKGEKPESKKEKTLAESGKDLADKIRKLKTQKGDTALDVTLGLKNLAVEAVAQLVEQGAKLADAIKNVLTDEKYKGLTEDDLTNHIIDGLDRQENKEVSFDKLKEFAKENETTDITPDMVKKNLIRDFVNSHIGEVEQKELFDEAFKGLKEILPNATKEKLLEAYLKENEFKQPTKPEVEGSLAQSKRELENIAKLTEDIADLENEKEIRKRNFPTEREKSEAEKELLKKKEAILTERKEKADAIKKEQQAIETEKNRQEKIIADLTDKKNKLEQGIREKTEKNKSQPDTPDIEQLKSEVKQSDKKLREAESEAKRLDREAQKKKDKLDELNAGINRAEKGYDQIKTHKEKSTPDIDKEIAAKQKELRKAIKTNATDEQQQKKALDNAIKNEKQKIKDFTERLAEGNFEDDAPAPKLKKQTAELINIAKERHSIEDKFRQKQKELRDKGKGNLEKVADTARSAYVALLIGAPKTLAKVGSMTIFNPVSDAATKLTFGKAFDAFWPSISKAAKLGGESSSIRSIQTGMEAFLRQMGQDGMNKLWKSANEKYDNAVIEYEKYKYSGSPDAKKLKQLKDKKDDALLKSVGTFIYQYIGGSSFKDMWGAFVNRTNEIEKQFGKIGSEHFKTDEFLNSGGMSLLGLNSDNANYIMGFIGRSHSALKTFSGRAKFAAGFMARLEGALESGEDITNSSRILEIAHESYLDWERGKYQQSNHVSDLWNKMTNSISAGEKGTEREGTAKVMTALLKSEVAITRVPVNILHEQVMEYTFGVFRALRDAAKVHGDVKKELEKDGFTNGEKVLDGLTYGTSKEAFKAELKNRISQMDSKQAATIVRCFRKGGMGVGLYALALVTAAIHFGIFPHLGQKKKKDEKNLKPDELNPGQVMIGDTKLGETASTVIGHAPVFWTTFMGIGLAQAYHDEINKGATTTQAAAKSIYTHIKVVEGGIPQFKLVQPLQEEVARTVKKRATDAGLVNEEGDTRPVKNYKKGGIDITTEERVNYNTKKEEELQKQVEKLKAGQLPENIVRDEETGKIVTKKYDDMTTKESVAAMRAIKTQVTNKVKKEMFGEKPESQKDKEQELRDAREAKKNN